jgi:RimJ/RimL family protein N-acetyltransferase
LSFNIREVEIRPTRLSDLSSLVVDCLNPVFLERKFLAITEAIPVDESMAYHSETIAAGHPHFVAIDKGRVVGLCDATPSAPARIAGQQHNFTLGMLLVPSHRGFGLGGKLLVAAVRACEGKCERIELNVYSHNERAHKLYLRHGFVEEGRRRCAWKLDGVTSDIIEMVLLI